MDNAQQEDKLQDAIEALYKQTKALNAGEAHFMIDKAFHDDKATVVMSVYIDQKPSNLILDELHQWAEQYGHTEVIDKIHELAEMQELIEDGE